MALFSVAVFRPSHHLVEIGKKGVSSLLNYRVLGKEKYCTEWQKIEISVFSVSKTIK